MRSPEFNTSDFRESLSPRRARGGILAPNRPKPYFTEVFHFQIVPSRIF